MPKNFADRYGSLFSQPQSDSKSSSCIVMRHIPAMEEIERICCLYVDPRHVTHSTTDHRLDPLLFQVFGSELKDVQFRIPDHYWDLPEDSPEAWGIATEYHRFEEQFETSDMGDEETVAFLLERGLDFRDKRGFPLRSTHLLKRQAEAAIKGIAGKLPDLEEAGARRFQSNLERDVANFQSRRKKSDPPPAAKRGPRILPAMK